MRQFKMNKKYLKPSLLVFDPSTENRTDKLSYISIRFDVSRRHLIISWMPTFSVIKHFKLIKNRSLRLFSSLVAFLKNTFCFEEWKKAFSHGVIQAIAFATHALLNMMLFEQSPMFFWSALTAKIRMPKESLGGFRCQTAICKTSFTRDVRIWLDIDQLTTLR